MKNIVRVFVLLFVVQFGWSQTTKILPSLKQKVEKTAMELATDETNPMDPVAVNAKLVWSEDKTQLAVIMKASIEDQWHIYAHVPETQPYIVSELLLELPKGINAIDDWELPHSSPYNDGIYIYEGALVFVQYCSVGKFDEQGKITSGLYYQTCDRYKCFPPETKTKDLSML